MFKKIFFAFMVASTLLSISNAYAGKVELTTYYPAPYGEYEDIRTKRLAVGPATQALPASQGNVTFTPQTGDPATKTGAFAGGSVGELAYSADNDAFYHYNGTSWVAQGGGGATAVTIYGTQSCPNVTGFTATRIYPGYVTIWQEWYNSGGTPNVGAGAGAGGFCSSEIIADTGSAWGTQQWWGQSGNARRDAYNGRVQCCVCIYK
jgi:hypothetical protein